MKDNGDTTLLPSPETENSLPLLESIVDALQLERRVLSEQLGEVCIALRKAELRYAKLVNESARISSIPPEVLSTIFEHGKAMADATDELADEAEESIIFPFELLASRVNTHFRTIALVTHRLWRSIHIAPGRSSARIAAYIKRSASCPLHVRIDLSGCFNNPGKGTLEMLEMILPQSYRWQRLSFVSERETSGNSLIMRILDHETPLLEHLSITINDVEQVDPNLVNYSAAQPHVLTGGAPKLSFVRLRGLAMHLFRPPLTCTNTLHLDQTKSLPIPYTTFQGIVKAPIGLEHLSIYGDIIGAETWPGEKCTIDLPTLRSLRICGVGGRIYSGVLLGINAPRLESLVLKDVQEHDLDGFWEKGAYMTRFPRLQSLIFCDFELSPFTYKHIFRAFPTVTDFASFHSSLKSSPISTLLTEEHTDVTPLAEDIPWPKLRSLTFLFDFGEEEVMMEEIVERRKTSGHPLGKLRLGTSYEDAFSEWCEELNVQNTIAIERFGNLDKWPADRNYPDQDDVLFI